MQLGVNSKFKLDSSDKELVYQINFSKENDFFYNNIEL